MKIQLPNLLKDKRHKFLAAIILGFISIGLVFQTLWLINDWFNGHYFQFNQVIKVEMDWPMTIKERELISPLATQSAVLKPIVIASDVPSPVKEKVRRSVDTLVDYIWFSESNRGTAPKGLHVTCKNKGMSNEWGYLPKPGHCFETWEEGRAAVYKWVQKKIELGYSDQELLCVYNIGHRLSNCEYLKSL